MLILRLAPGDTITLFDQDAGTELDESRRLHPRDPQDPGSLLGFNFGRGVKILRGKVLNTKGAVDANANG